MTKKHLEIGEPVPDFIHLGHTIAFSIQDYEFGKIADDAEIKNDLILDTTNMEKLARGMAAKMLTCDEFRSFIMYTAHIYETMLLGG